MKLELIIILGTAFFIANTYYDGKLLTLLKSYQKYYTMAFYAFIGICIYLLFKKQPDQSHDMLKQANSIIKYMPIDKSAMSIMNPLIDLTGHHNTNFDKYGDAPAQEQRILRSGGKATKRSVSETKKKWVASNQNWTCGSCKKQLNAWFEVDHKTRLEHGGSNHVNNLVALCRECHGRKTAQEKLDL